MLLFLCLPLLAAYATAGPLLDETKRMSIADMVKLNTSDMMFEMFKTSYGKQYDSAQEEEERRRIFKDNYQYITDQEANRLLGEISYSLGVNEFADLTLEEFLATYTGFKTTIDPTDATTIFAPSNDPIPDQVDWTKKGYVTPIKNQGQCGSCWAFSTTGTLEGQLFKSSGRLVSLSEQQLVDCSGSFGNHGCQGGLPINAYKYINKAGGIESEEDYPYEAKNDVCRFNESLVKVGLMGWAQIDNASEETLQQGTAIIGPISVGIDASHRSFQFYSGGIYNEPNCSSTKLDHGVLVVGYGTNPDYWLVKNSWGTSWGMSGYIKMSRNKNNQCGIATMATYPLL